MSYDYSDRFSNWQSGSAAEIETTTPSTVVFQDKFLWRCIVRDLFEPGTGTPVTLSNVHLPALENALQRIDEFTTSPYSSGRIHYGGIGHQDLLALPSLIEAIKQGKEVLLLD